MIQILAIVVIPIGLVLWVSLPRRWGTAGSLRAIPTDGPIGPKLESFPVLGEVQWVKHPDRPRRIRVTGRTDVRTAYKWSFNSDMPTGYTGMYTIDDDGFPGAIGNKGYRCFGVYGTSGIYYYNVTILLDGRFRMDIHRLVPVKLQDKFRTNERELYVPRWWRVQPKR